VQVFICLEGIDGAGKSTQTRMLQQKLAALGYKVELVADPGTTKIGTAIRQLLLENDGPITPVAQMLLFSAARAELSAYIRKLIARKTIVVCDRWILSTLVYQGVLNKLPPTAIIDIFNLSNCLYPDLCFLLDLPPESAKKRMGRPRDRYERRCMADRRLMRRAYLDFATYGDYAATSTTQVVDASKSPEETHELICSVVCAALAECGIAPKRKDSSRARRRSGSKTRT
jgi:dTMP kinase